MSDGEETEIGSGPENQDSRQGEDSDGELSSEEDEWHGLSGSDDEDVLADDDEDVPSGDTGVEGEEKQIIPPENGVGGTFRLLDDLGCRCTD